MRESVIAPLRIHSDKFGKGTGQYGPSTLAATWGGFSDQSTGVGSVQLCFGVAGTSSDTHACAFVPQTGLAVAALPLIDRATYTASLMVADRVGRNSTFTSAGVQIFASPALPASVSMTHPDTDTQNGSPQSTETVLSADCNAVHVEWAPFEEPGCTSNTTYSWQLCDSLGVCGGALTLPMGSLAADQQSARLKQSHFYSSRLTATSCSGIAVSGSSNGFVCDESAPVLIGTPSLSPLNDDALSPRSAQPGLLLATWNSVFSDHESGLERFEYCLVRGDVAGCDGNWMSAGSNFSATLLLPPSVTNVAPSFSVQIRATNGAGLAALATSEALSVDRWSPKVTRVSIDGYVRGEGQPCALNRTDNLLVSWESADEGSGLREHAVTATAIWDSHLQNTTGTVAVAGANSREVVIHNLTTTSFVQYLTTLRIHVVATDRSSQTGSDFIDCKVVTQRPTVGVLWVHGAVKLSDGVFGIDVAAYPVRQVCWSGIEGDVEKVRFWISLASDPNVLSTDASTALEVSVNSKCLFDTSQLVDGVAYVLRLAAISTVGLLGPPAELMLVTDDQGPLASGSVKVHTGAQSNSVQVSNCCLKVSFDPFEEPETRVSRYLVCPSRSNGTSACLDIGQSTRALIQAPLEDDCACSPPEDWLNASIVWNSFVHGIALARNTSAGNGTGNVIAFTLRAVNSLGQSSVVGPLAVKVDRQPRLPLIEFEAPSALADSNATDRCAPHTKVDVLHPAGDTLTLVWEAEERAEENSSEPLPTYKICVQNLAALTDAECIDASAANGIARVKNLSAGLFNLSVTKTSVGGLNVSKSWQVLSDGTPPIMGEVRVGNHASYWSHSRKLSCVFDAATDPESGINNYLVSLVGPLDVCGQSAPHIFVNRALANVSADCNLKPTTTVELPAVLEHGATFRCIVTASNGAGLTATRSSTDVVVDLAAMPAIGGVKLQDSEGMALKT